LSATTVSFFSVDARLLLLPLLRCPHAAQQLLPHNITMLCNAHPVVAVVVFEPTVLLLLPSTRLIVAK